MRAEELYSTSLELAGFTKDPLVHGSHEEVG
jgi:hypothetical protein